MDPSELIELEEQEVDVQGGDRAPTCRRVLRLDRPALHGALIAAGSYVALRAAISGVHALRRRFLRRLLLDVAAALTATGTTHWADFGCLLGLTRGGDLIIYDNDVDFAVLDPDWASLIPELKRRLEPKYSVKVVTPAGGDPSCGSPWVRVYCPLGMADLFSAYLPRPDPTAATATAGAGASPEKSDAASMILIDFGHGDTMHIPKDLVLPTAELKWRGARLAVPQDAHGVLEWRYGASWRTPRYMEKGADEVEGSKPYARVLRALAAVGIRV